MSQYMKFIFFAASIFYFSPLLNAADTHQNIGAYEENGWKSLFETLLPGEQIKVEVLGNNIVIHAAGIREVKKQLDRVLSSNTEFFKQLNYEVKNITKWLDKDIKNDNIKMPDNISSAIAYVKGAFGPDMFKRIKVSEEDLFDINEGARFEDGILYSSALSDSKICNRYVDCWMSRIAGLSVGQIRSAVRDRKEPPRKNEVFKSKEIASVCGPFQACCAVMEFGKQSQIIFDIKKIHELITPPVIQELSNGDLIINQVHLITYLRQLTGNGMLLRIFKLDEEHYAEPIMIPSHHRSQKPSNHYVLIDRSASMEKHFSKLTEHLEQFVAKIADGNKSSKIHLIFFAQQSIRKDLNLCDKESITCSIRDSRDNVGGNTALLDTIYNAIEEIKSERITDSFNVTLTIFTDGRDNESRKNKEELEHLVGSMAQEFRPKIFALGFGEADEQFLRELSHNLVGPYLKLNSIDDFKIIERHVDSFKHESQVIEFLLNLLKGHSMSLRVPVVQNNTPQSLKLILPVTQNRINLEIQGQPINVEIMDTNSVKSGVIADKIATLRSQSIAIVGSNATPNAKIRELATILAKLRDIKVFDREHINMRDIAIAKVQQDITGISQGNFSTSSGSYNYFDI